MGGLKSVGVSNGTTLKRQNWGTDAPIWYRANHGLCLEGVCNNATCIANGQTIMMSISYAKFDLGKQQITNHVPASIVSDASKCINSVRVISFMQMMHITVLMIIQMQRFSGSAQYWKLLKTDQFKLINYSHENIMITEFQQKCLSF